MLNIKNNLKIRRKALSTYDDWIDTTDKSINSSINNYQKIVKIDKKNSLDLTRQIFCPLSETGSKENRIYICPAINYQNKCIVINSKVHL
jgi:hypothetical protein